MNSETTINFCFMREKSSNFTQEINRLLNDTFKEMDFTWKLEEKDSSEAEIVIAKLNGTSDWTVEDEVVRYLDEKAEDIFWQHLYGLQITTNPVMRGCNCCGSN